MSTDRRSSAESIIQQAEAAADERRQADLEAIEQNNRIARVQTAWGNVLDGTGSLEALAEAIDAIPAKRQRLADARDKWRAKRDTDCVSGLAWLLADAIMDRDASTFRGVMRAETAERWEAIEAVGAVLYGHLAEADSASVTDGSPHESPNTVNSRSNDNLTGEAKAIALLVQNPSASNVDIAAAVPCHRATLYKWPKFMVARKALKTGKSGLPRDTCNFLSLYSTTFLAVSRRHSRDTRPSSRFLFSWSLEWQPNPNRETQTRPDRQLAGLPPIETHLRSRGLYEDEYRFHGPRW